MAIPKQVYIFSYNGVTLYQSSNCKWLFDSLINNQKELDIIKFMHYATCIKNVKKGKKVAFKTNNGRTFHMHQEPVIQQIMKPGTMKCEILL